MQKKEMVPWLLVAAMVGCSQPGATVSPEAEVAATAARIEGAGWQFISLKLPTMT